jgi:hypothetical protein
MRILASPREIRELYMLLVGDLCNGHVQVNVKNTIVCSASERGFNTVCYQYHTIHEYVNTCTHTIFKWLPCLSNMLGCRVNVT